MKSVPELDHVVYVLVTKADPKRVRYVGLTIRRYRYRFSQHWCDTGREGRLRPVAGWMKKHGKENVTIIPIEHQADKDNLKAAEIKWISHYRALGMADLNITDGGESGNGNPFSAEWRAAKSAEMMGHPYWGRGPHTQETKDRIRDYQLSNPVSTEDRSIRQATKLVPEKVVAIRELAAEGVMWKTIGELFGVTPTTARQVALRQRWSWVK